MAEDRDFANLTTNIYAQELVQFVVRHHGIEWHSVVSHEHWENVTQIFHEDVGKIVVAYAKGSEKGDLIRTAGMVRRIQSHSQYERYCTNFRDGFFRCYGNTPPLLLKYFAYVIEYSLLLYEQGLDDSPLIAVGVIAASLMHVDHGRFVMSGGLNELNKCATLLLASSPSLRESYEEGEFAWCNAR